MIIASTLFLVVGIITFIIGVFTTSDLTLIVVSIVASLLAALTLAVGVMRDRKRVVAVAEGGLGDAAPASYAASTEAVEAAIVEPSFEADPIDLMDAEEAIPEPPSLRALEDEEAPTAIAPAPKKIAARKPTAKKTAAKKAAPKKTAAKKKAAPKKVAAKKAAPKKTAAKKTVAKKAAPKKTAAKKTVAKKAAPKKAAPKKTAAKKTVAKKAAPKKAAAKKSSAKKR